MISTHRLSVLAAAALLTGCASVSSDGLRSDVAALTAGRTAGVAQAALPAMEPSARAKAQQSIDGWLAQPLTQDAAVRIALLNNPGLQARLAALGVADAERVQAITLPNPHLTLGRFTNSQEREIERTLAFGVMDLITLPGAPSARPSACRSPHCKPRKTWCNWPQTPAEPGCAPLRPSRWLPRTTAWSKPPR